MKMREMLDVVVEKIKKKNKSKNIKESDVIKNNEKYNEDDDF